MYKALQKYLPFKNTFRKWQLYPKKGEPKKYVGLETSIYRRLRVEAEVANQKHLLVYNLCKMWPQSKNQRKHTVDGKAALELNQHDPDN